MEIEIRRYRNYVMGRDCRNNGNLVIVFATIAIWFVVGFVIGGYLVWAWNPWNDEGMVRVLVGLLGGMVLFFIPGLFFYLGWSVFTDDGRKSANEEWEKQELKRLEKRQRRQANPVRQSIIKAFFWGIGFGAGRSLTGGDSHQDS